MTSIKRPVNLTRKIVISLLLFILFASLAFFVWFNAFYFKSNTYTLTQVQGQDKFPVGVNTATKLITENPAVDLYVETYLSIKVADSRKKRFQDKLLAQIAKWDFYQNLASPVSRILVIYSGERKEEIIADFAEILKWNKAEQDLFASYITEAEPALAEGKFFPGRYIVSIEATPENVADVLYENFNQEILKQYDESVEQQVPLIDGLTIASLIEREAYDFNDMRYISGVIWNRLFIDMPLQLDATLQYAKGSKTSEKHWWPKVIPADKFIDSPYNTYANIGLPPAPISNPSTEAIVAALNPKNTDCMYYFHGPKGQFYCSVTYEEHVNKLKEIYGRGK